jgi:MoxR-like ATPase
MSEYAIDMEALGEKIEKNSTFIEDIRKELACRV